MTNKRIAVPIFVCAAVLSFPIDDAESATLNAIDELKACARNEDTDERLTCYDALGDRVLAGEAEAAEKTAMPAATATAVAASTETTAVVPAAATAPAAVVASEDDKNKTVHGHVKSCQPTSDRRWFFILDSGEVWKQSGGKTRRFEDCDFNVTIRKDLFGYKMSIEGDDSTVRVRRHKK